MSPTRNIALLSSLAVLMAATGCASLYDGHYEKTQKFRAMKAWYGYSWSSDEKYSCDYKDGWKAGYYDVLTGNCGKPPMFPPKKYWCPNQITKECDLNRYEWYIGFHDGVNCARLQPDTHYLRPWMPEYCEPQIQGSMLSEPMLEPLPNVEVPEPTSNMAVPPTTEPASN